MQSLIYDFETLGTNPRESAIVSLAALVFDSSKFHNGYDYDELLGMTRFVKFDVEDQVRNHGRTIDPDTLVWWSELGPGPMEQLKPSPNDMSIVELHDWITSIADPQTVERVYTRGNTFDPIFLESILDGDPYPFWKLRDTRSTIEGMTLLNPKIKNAFIVPGLEDKFIAHDARHDVVMDVLRLQYFIQE